VNDFARRALDVQNRARDEIPAGRNEEERLADGGQSLRRADRAVVVELEATGDCAANRDVTGEPLTAPPVAHPHTNVAAHVVLAIASNENSVNSAFFAQITHLILLGRYDRGVGSPYMWDKVGPKNRRGPWLLRPDNFTPGSRTPWGGRRIVERLKSDLVPGHDGPVGEAWELSVEPDFPSQLLDGPLLDEVLRADPTLLGREAPLGSTGLLVKLVDAADELSLQIHPSDDDPALEPGQSGKPEAWYIVDADPGAGLYLGFKEGVTRQDVELAIADEARLDELMAFVEVSPGDIFVIEPGTPHAIGRGVLLLEPQQVTPGKRGVTYRYWDWNRRYDAAGQPDESGEPRPLHVERALEVTDWGGPRERELIDRIRYPGGPAASQDSATLETLTSPSGPLHSDRFILRRLAGSGQIEVPAEDRLRALTVIEGVVRIIGEHGALDVKRGQTAALPASLGPLRAALERAHAMICALA